MSFFVTTWRVIVASWKNFTRNIWLALTTIFVLVLALMSVNVLVGVNVLLGNAVHVLEDKIDVSVYFKPQTPQAVLEQAKFFMAGLPQVKSVTLLSSDQALQDFKDRHKNDPKILAAVGELDQNPLGGTLILKARTPADYPFLIQALQNPQFDFAIESKNFDDHSETIRRVQGIGDSARKFGLALIIIFAVFSMLLVFNTIRVAIYTQREEIGVMRLVGASSAYVRIPFVLEGILLALLAVAISIGGVLSVANYLDPRLAMMFDGTDPGLFLYVQSHLLEIVGVEGGILSLLVGISSWAAAGKYLKR